MTEAIHKLQPHRTMHLRGFDGRGAAGALHSASETGFKVSGAWGAQSDFCVLTVWDADDFFEHPRMKYLPDMEFAGMTLQFEIEPANCMRLDDSLWASTDWPYLDVIYADGSTGRVKLAEHAEAVAGGYVAATAEFLLEGSITTSGGYVEVCIFDRHYTFAVWYDNTAVQLVAALANAINADAANTGLWASASGNRLTVEYQGLDGRAGAAGNRAGIYAGVNGPNPLWWTPAYQIFSGGQSPTKHRVSLDFSAAYFTSTKIRKMWLTFAPDVQTGAFTATEWLVTVTNWTVAGGGALKVAGAGSVRVGSRDSWVSYSGAWAEEAGWYWKGFARRASAAGDKVTVRYACGQGHDLYLGTSLYSDRGSVSITVDGVAVPGGLNCWLAEEPAVVTRRLVRSGVAAGQHVVEITLTGGGYFYFDFLEAAVVGDVPDAPATYANIGLATDWDTDHSYKLSPERLAWNLDRLGFRGDVNHYVGVFWWTPRLLDGGTLQVSTVTFGGLATFSVVTTLRIGNAAFDKLHFVTDTPEAIARAFALRINEISAAFWARAEGPVLTIYGRAQGADYRAEVACSTTDTTLTINVTNTNLAVSEGAWVVDTESVGRLNRAAIDWHAGFFGALAARGLTCTAAFSMEVVHPPAGWAARFPDGTAVETATGFGTLKSTHCAFCPAMAAWQGQAFAEMAALMVAAGLSPRLQCGEFVWWYFAAVGGGMAFYDDETKAAAVAALGRALYVFSGPGDDPGVNGYADANFLRARIKAHVDTIRTAVLAAVPGAQFELLWPLDVNETPAKRLNGYVNLPVEYGQKAGSGLVRLKMEGLAYGAVERNLDKARQAVRFPWVTLAWSKADVTYLVPWFNGGCPWQEEVMMAGREGVGGVAMWAWDHLALFGWPLPLPGEGRRSTVLMR